MSTQEDGNVTTHDGPSMKPGTPSAPRHIAVATDLSETSGDAVAYAAALAARLCVPLTLAHAIELRVLPGEERGFEEVLSESEASVREQLDRLATKLRERGVTVSVAVDRGWPLGPTVVGIAERAGADLLVVGTHGRTGLARLVLGSVAERLVRLSSSPVLVVRSRA
jgi:nucleotide-binding universal stress UspA family protein